MTSRIVLNNAGRREFGLPKLTTGGARIDRCLQCGRSLLVASAKRRPCPSCDAILLCPCCGQEDELAVVDTRRACRVVVRRRKCSKCKHRFSTVERLAPVHLSEPIPTLWGEV